MTVDLDRVFAGGAIRRDMPADVRVGASEIQCVACRNLMIPFAAWPAGEPVTSAIVARAPDGRVGCDWRCFVCLRRVVVTWMPRTA